MAEAMVELNGELVAFANKRDWNKYYTVRNLTLALLTEVGELSDLLTWKGDTHYKETVSFAEVDKLCQELADVRIYLIRMIESYGLVEEVRIRLNRLGP